MYLSGTIVPKITTCIQIAELLSWIGNYSAMNPCLIKKSDVSSMVCW